MNHKKSQKNTFKEFISNDSNIGDNSEEMNVDSLLRKQQIKDKLFPVENANMRELPEKLKKLSESVHPLSSASFVLDYSKKKYLYCSESVEDIVGFSAADFYACGPSEMLGIIQKEDLKIFNEKIFTTNLDFLNKTPQSEHCDFVFSYNFRIETKDRRTANLLQKSTYITSSETGLPILSYGTLIDVTNIMRDDGFISHTIEKVGKGVGRDKILIVSNSISTREELTLLSEREKSVLGFMAEGFSSKMLAEKLKISINTVHNHRQNILKKTNTQNVAQLIAFAVKNGLI
ncbi:hypothetical protein BH09BAC5_BH09BAC5_01410 [soil metagenome]